MEDLFITKQVEIPTKVVYTIKAAVKERFSQCLFQDTSMMAMALSVLVIQIKTLMS